jgi:ribonuclease HII
VPQEKAISEQRLIAGVDEAGRGSLAGPVIAAAVILDPDSDPITGLDDSKRLSPKHRRYVAELIFAHALAWAIGRAEASEVDRLNVLQASLLAMRRALSGLRLSPDWVRVDGDRLPMDVFGEAVVRGDALFPEIMAASILAKVMRDRELAMLDLLYPGYDFDRHKGYPTARHRLQLETKGSCSVHRVTFAPVVRIST